MPDSADANEAIWRSDAAISHWVSTAEDRERRRADERRLMAELLPFDKDQQFTFVDLGAGTGAAARVVLDYFPGAQGILADYSLQMMEQGRRELSPSGIAIPMSSSISLAAPGQRRSRVGSTQSSPHCASITSPMSARGSCSPRSWSTCSPVAGTSITTLSRPRIQSSKQPGSGPETAVIRRQ